MSRIENSETLPRIHVSDDTFPARQSRLSPLESPGSADDSVAELGGGEDVAVACRDHSGIGPARLVTRSCRSSRDSMVRYWRTKGGRSTIVTCYLSWLCSATSSRSIPRRPSRGTKTGRRSSLTSSRRSFIAAQSLTSSTTRNPPEGMGLPQPMRRGLPVDCALYSFIGSSPSSTRSYQSLSPSQEPVRWAETSLSYRRMERLRHSEPS